MFAELIEKLKTARANEKTFTELLEQKQAVRDAKIEAICQEYVQSNAELIANAEAAMFDSQTADKQLRDAIRSHYDATGEKKPAEGLGVRVSTSLKISDQKKALAWAKQNASACVVESVDEKALVAVVEALQKNGGQFDFIREQTLVTPTIAKEL